MVNRHKVLLFMNQNNLKPSGGPFGYLYNVKYAIDKYKIDGIDFLNQNQMINNKKNIKFSLAKKLPKSILDLRLMHNVYTAKKAKKTDFNNYEVIHFHNTYNLYLNRENLKYFDGKVLLTSHSPKPTHVEIIEEQLNKWHLTMYPGIKEKLQYIDRYAFERADFLVFPCEEAEEPYYNNWVEYEEIKRKKKNSYKYILTGTKPSKAKIDLITIREKYNIPKEAFVICYVGRHNETKGFDILKKIGQSLIEKHENIYFLVAGKEEPLKGLNHKRWIEVGWTNDPHSIIAASNMFLLPNRETYFDLIMLEVLSLGKIILASNTGGNKYFEKINNGGISLYNDEADAIKQIQRIISISETERRQIENGNVELFENYFTMEKFINNYTHMINDICVKEKGSIHNSH